jgi:hypothetical protein
MFRGRTQRNKTPIIYSDTREQRTSAPWNLRNFHSRNSMPCMLLEDHDLHLRCWVGRWLEKHGHVWEGRASRGTGAMY